MGATDQRQINDFDAASKTGIDDVRAITDTLMYKPIGVKPIKALIIDECHALSSAAWKALLKILEEPPPWVYWFLCTTEPGKVPTTIRTRCAGYNLQPVSRDELFDLLSSIAKKEKCLQDEAGEKILALCAKEAGGSPRQAIVNMAVCQDCENFKDARELLRSADGLSEVTELARALDSGNLTWLQAQSLLTSLKETNPESIRQIIRAWFTKAALNAKDEKAFGHRLGVLDAFSTPFPSTDGISPVLMAVARLRFSK